MSRILDQTKVKYLAFEGGGGKGVAYLGAVRALEDPRLGILPVSKGKIKGISGSSAGAITALFLAMGFDSHQLEHLLNLKEEFNAFFDSPKPGLYRSINSENLPDIKTDCPSNLQLGDFVLSHLKTIETAISDQSVIALILYRRKSTNLKAFFDKKKGDSIYPILEALGKNIDIYIQNLLFDRGIFPGFAIRKFFDKWISWTLNERFKGTKIKGGEINFEQFHTLTGIDLVITGTNLTQRQPHYFSSKCTPKFPVAEAVAISMNIPMLFKPIWIDAIVSTGCTDDSEAYKGFWVDGGVLNNLPIHAFDQKIASYSKQNNTDPDLLPLNPNILALRLTDGFPNLKGNLESTKQRSVDGFSTFLEYLNSLFGTLLFPSEDGQIRTQSEEEQTIPLYTYDLSTLEFSPSAEKSKYPQDRAEETVFDYFYLKKKN